MRTMTETQTKALQAVQDAQGAVSARDIGARENTMRALLRRGMVKVHHTEPQPVGDRRWYYVPAVSDARQRVTVERTVLDDPEDVRRVREILAGRVAGEVPADMFGGEPDATYYAQVWDFDGQDWTPAQVTR